MNRSANPNLGHDQSRTETHEVLNLPPDITLKEELCKKVHDAMLRAGWSEDDNFMIDLGFREAFINAVAHGTFGLKKEGTDDDLEKRSEEKFKNDPGDKKIGITINIDPDRIELVIKDEGLGFDLKDVADPTAPENLMETSGRGLFLMKAGFDEIKVHSSENGCEVALIKTRRKN